MEEKWFSLFKRGIELLADMSTIHGTKKSEPNVQRKNFPKELQSANTNRRVPCSRTTLIQKTKTKGRQGYPQHLGMASHNNWAWRPTDKGHGVPRQLDWSHRTRARCPTGNGPDVPVWNPENITQFGNSLVTTFFPFRWSNQWAEAASSWLSGATEFKQTSWYEPILGHLSCLNKKLAKNANNATGPRCCVSSTETKLPMVERNTKH